VNRLSSLKSPIFYEFNPLELTRLKEPANLFELAYDSEYSTLNAV